MDTHGDCQLESTLRSNKQGGSGELIPSGNHKWPPFEEGRGWPSAIAGIFSSSGLELSPEACGECLLIADTVRTVSHDNSPSPAANETVNNGVQS
jgi:hypothetical protein